MKHSDLKIGLKVKDKVYGIIYTIRDITTKNMFSVEEQPSTYFYNSEYFEPVEEAKEKETMNTESNLISLDKKYKTRCGYPVRVLCVDRKDTVWPVVAMYQKENCEGVSFHKINDGTAWNGRDLDLIEVSPYEDFKKDDKVMVRDYEDFTWNKRYFAYEKAGKVYCFENGQDSWTSDNQVTSWNYCRKPTQEELGK